MTGEDARPPTLAEVEHWRKTYEEDDRRYLYCVLPWLANTYSCQSFLVIYRGPPWWLVECPCAEPKPCFHMAAVAEVAHLYAAEREAARADRQALARARDIARFRRGE
jgi:hypothetical protein